NGDCIRDLNVKSNQVDFINSGNILTDNYLIKDRLISTNNNLIPSSSYNSYIYLKLDSGVKYYYTSNNVKNMRVVVYYNDSKLATRVVESADSIILQPNESYVSFAVSSTNSVNYLSKNKDFESKLNGVKVQGVDIENLSITPNDTSFIISSNILLDKDKASSKVVMPDGSIIDSNMYDSYFNLKLDKLKEYYFYGNAIGNMRTATYYNQNNVKTRCVENATTIMLLEGEDNVSISIVKNNTVTKLSRSRNFENELEGIKVNSSDIVGLDDIQAYDQNLNTNSDVTFKSISVSGDIPVGTLANPPVGLQKGDVWADATTSSIYPVLRVKI
ncbi:MAG: hypothetical protein ACRC7N_07080, partial [Clostridium sp.]